MTLGQYTEYCKILNTEQSDIDKRFKLLSIFNNIKYDDIVKMSLPELKKLTFPKLEDIDLVNFKKDFTVNVAGIDKKYSLIDDMSDMNLYQYEDIQTYIESGDYTSLFTVCTYNKNNYKVSHKLVDDFPQRVEEFKNLDSGIWGGYFAHLIKKKNFSMDYSEVSLKVEEIQNLLIVDITNSLNYLLSLMTTLRPQMSFIRYYTWKLYLHCIIFLSKRLKPEQTSKLVSNLIIRLTDDI